MIPMDRLEQIRQRFQFLEASMSAGSDGADFAAIAKEYADLRPVVAQIEAYFRLRRDLEEAEAMLSDPEMAELARDELPALRAALPKAETCFQIVQIPRYPTYELMRDKLRYAIVHTHTIDADEQQPDARLVHRGFS